MKWRPLLRCFWPSLLSLLELKDTSSVKRAEQRNYIFSCWLSLWQIVKESVFLSSKLVFNCGPPWIVKLLNSGPLKLSTRRMSTSCGNSRLGHFAGYLAFICSSEVNCLKRVLRSRLLSSIRKQYLIVFRPKFLVLLQQLLWLVERFLLELPF